MIDLCLWPHDRLGAALAVLAQRAGLAEGARAAALAALPAPADAADLDPWLAHAAARLGLEAQAVQCQVPQAGELLLRGGPALLRLTDCGFVLLLGRRGRTLRLVGPDLRERRLPLAALRDRLCAPAEAPLAAEVDSLLAAALVPPARRDRARRALLAERLAGQPLQGCWLLRHAPGTSYWRQLLHARLPQQVGLMLALFAGLYALELLGWRLIGQAALDGRFDTGWLAAWALLLAALVPLRLLTSALNSCFALTAGRLLKQRLLAGALRLDLDLVKRQGTGQWLGRVIESQALETTGLAGALGVAVAALELAFAAWVLGQGAAPHWHLGLLAAWLLVNLALTAHFHARLKAWTLARLAMTEGLVERMVGHRTRLAQERAARRAAEEDREAMAYLESSQALDASVPLLVSAAPGGWVLLGLAGLGPALLAGGANTGALAISLGGVLFAHRALGGLTGGLSALARAAIAWQQVAPLFHAAAQEDDECPWLGGALDEPAPRLVDAQQLAFGYAQAAPVLQGVDLQVRAGERVLLSGPSGGGKSTLAALIVGLRAPSAGLLLLNGLDRATLGADWQRLATEAPQFHDNHVYTGTLAFNLLLGREWPATEAQVAEARALCEALGLGELLARMPAGLQQRVGETGWQLSHGERSRLFLARALLQRARLTVLDESFAALDPATLQRCLARAIAECTGPARSLLVIAHP